MRTRLFCSLMILGLFSAGLFSPSWANADCYDIAYGTYTLDQAERRDQFIVELKSHLATCASSGAFKQTLAHHLIEKGEIAEARALIESAKPWRPDDEPIYQYLLGIIDTREGRLADAMATGNTLIRQWPEWHDGYHLVREALEKQDSDNGSLIHQLGMSYDTATTNIYTGAYFRSLTDRQFWIQFGLAAFVAVLTLAMGLFDFKRKRAAQALATSLIRSAAQGYVELNGQVFPIPGQALSAPYSHGDCVWFEYEHVEYNRAREETRTIAHEISAMPFLLKDETGECRIYPKGAEISGVPQKAYHVSDHTHTERLLTTGTRIHAIGLFLTQQDAAGKQVHTLAKPQDGRDFIISGYSKKTRVILLSIGYAVSIPLFVSAVLVMGWIYYQRFYVFCCPVGT